MQSCKPAIPRPFIPPGRRLILLAVLVMVGGCASAPFDIEGTLPEVSVAQVRATMAERGELSDSEDTRVLWGGAIVKTENLESTTQLEILGYPLDRRQRPISSRDAQGRFIINYQGFLEPVDFSPGRFITVLGTLSGVRSGTVGQAQYRYPLVQSSNIHLWHPDELRSRPRISFGLGINLGN